MVFSSLEFIFIFLPVFFVVYFCMPGKVKNIWLFLGSLVFYGYGMSWNLWYILLLPEAVLVNYLLAKWMEKRKKEKDRKILLTAGLIYDFGWLFFFKYSGVPIALPIGISFYTFQIASYLIDVYRRDIMAEKSFVNLGAYLTMFPQLIAGPIVTYSTVQDRLRYRKHSMYRLNDGLKTFTLGLGLKVLLANRFGSLWTDLNTIGVDSISTPFAWFGILCYSLQIYFDFYGYSLMAKGLGRIMGFSIPDNFKYPYMSLSMTEFWRRWHITLGSWFREYIYIPLGGNRNGIPRQFLNMFVVWLLTGIWHGCSWNFVLWGLFLFAVMLLEKCGVKRFMERFPIIGHLYMWFLIPISWTFFVFTNLTDLFVFFGKLFPFQSGMPDVTIYSSDIVKYGTQYLPAVLIGLLFCTGFPRRIYDKNRKKMWMQLVLLGIFWGCIYCLYLGMDDPFLYYRF